MPRSVKGGKGFAYAGKDPFVTPTGKPVAFEMWAMPGKDEHVQGIYNDYKAQFENPGSLQDFVDGSLESLTSYGAVFIPGGQHEMIHSSSKSDHVVLNSRHRGFIKVSLQTGSSLVPVFSFGEKNIFDNFPTPITWQLRAKKALRANIFFLPYGQFLMSIPRQTRIRLAVGKPIHVPVVANPSDELINILRDHYFTELLNLIEKLKKKCDSPNTKVEVRPQVSTVTKQDWFEKLKQLEKNVYQKDGPNIDVVQHDDPLLTMKLNHVSWTNEVTFCAAFFILAFAVIVQRSGLFW